MKIFFDKNSKKIQIEEREFLVWGSGFSAFEYEKALSHSNTKF